jgi:alpha-ketoglutarate-dependent taurine dioxygenase
LDLSATIGEDDVDLLKATYGKCGVLVFRNQKIDDAALVRFARHFGELQTFQQPGREKNVLSEIFRTANTDINGKLVADDSETAKMLRINWLWHIDSCYREIPARGVVMYASDISGEGGNTIFVNAAASYDDLPQNTKQRIECLTARHSFEYLINNHDLPPLSAEEAGQMPKADQPMVRQHGDGRRSLFLSPPYMEPIDGLSEQESTSLVTELTDFATQERYRYCHEWQRHDVIIWDNSWTMHRVTPFDISNKKRVMRGATILGSEPVHPVS